MVDGSRVLSRIQPGGLVAVKISDGDALHLPVAEVLLDRVQRGAVRAHGTMADVATVVFQPLIGRL